MRVEGSAIDRVACLYAQQSLGDIRVREGHAPLPLKQLHHIRAHSGRGEVISEAACLNHPVHLEMVLHAERQAPVRSPLEDALDADIGESVELPDLGPSAAGGEGVEVLLAGRKQQFLDFLIQQRFIDLTLKRPQQTQLLLLPLPQPTNIFSHHTRLPYQLQSPQQSQHQYNTIATARTTSTEQIRAQGFHLQPGEKKDQMLQCNHRSQGIVEALFNNILLQGMQLWDAIDFSLQAVLFSLTVVMMLYVEMSERSRQRQRAREITTFVCRESTVTTDSNVDDSDVQSFIRKSPLLQAMPFRTTRVN